MPVLNLEHFACNVSDPAAMAAWYVEHLGMQVVRRVPTPPYMHFLADAAGRAVIEIYSNTADPYPTTPTCTRCASTLRLPRRIRTPPAPRLSPRVRRLSTSRRCPMVRGS